jgi:hypothetical protein
MEDAGLTSRFVKMKRLRIEFGRERLHPLFGQEILTGAEPLPDLQILKKKLHRQASRS